MVIFYRQYLSRIQQLVKIKHSTAQKINAHVRSISLCIFWPLFRNSTKQNNINTIWCACSWKSSDTRPPPTHRTHTQSPAFSLVADSRMNRLLRRASFEVPCGAVPGLISRQRGLQEKRVGEKCVILLEIEGECSIRSGRGK